MLWDLMHILFVGVANDVAGSAMFLLCSMKFWGDVATNTQLQRAHKEFSHWCSKHGLPCCMEAFDTNSLGFGSKSYPKLTTKAANVKVVIY